ncbi:MAG TPA: hypothetical protein VIH18_37000 [Candidatus Binatia bacterium]|jgi:hypothetical protein
MTSKNILLVCSVRSDAAEGRLRAVGCEVTKVADGRAAVSLTKRYGFDAAVLISTGTEMDVTETALNLRDVNPPMQIFIIADKSLSARQLHSRSHVAERIPDTITLGIKELTNYLAAIDPQSYPPKGSIKTTPAREQQACDSTPKNRG